jgi:hypothetical protein
MQAADPLAGAADLDCFRSATRSGISFRAARVVRLSKVDLRNETVRGGRSKATAVPNNQRMRSPFWAPHHVMLIEISV